MGGKMGTQNIDLDLMEKQGKLLSQAIEDFRPYVTNFLEPLLQEIEKNNSDFIIEVEKIMEAFKDDKGKVALQNASAYYQAVVGVRESWIEVENKIKGDIKEGEN